MPKKPMPDKKTGARNQRAKPVFRKAPSSINDLLLRRPTFTALAARIPEQQSWCEWLRSVMPTELAPHIVNVIPKGSELVVLADSPAWCARLRYAVAALEAQIVERDAAMRRSRVRVSMA
jgi:Dna[CI] antecedent, DciA